MAAHGVAARSNTGGGAKPLSRLSPGHLDVMSYFPLAPFSSAASAASALAGAAYDGLLGTDGEGGSQKGLFHDAALAATRAQHMAGNLAEMLVFARTDLDTALTPATHVVRGIREVGHRASQLFQRLRSSTLEFLSLEQSNSSEAELLGLSRHLWYCWHGKHEALTAAEHMYSTLLSESRRLGALTAELSVLTALLEEEGGDGGGTIGGQALERCQQQIRSQAAEAIQAFKERSKDYPCGCPHPRTGLLRIARTEEDLHSICEAFAISVVEQENELLAQVEELSVVSAEPRTARTLISSLSRRVAFWEEQIEENWSQWSLQSGRFHEAQTGAVECWEKLHSKASGMLAQAESIRLGEAQSDALYKVLVEVARTLALLGAWAGLHNLRGDGHVLMDVRDLLHGILRCLQTHFKSYQGCEAVKQQLLDNDFWQLIQVPLECPGREAWWHPAEWPFVSTGGDAACAAPSSGWEHGNCCLLY